MTLGAFQPKARIQGDKLDLVQYAGRPMLVRINEYVPDMTSQRFPNPKPVVFFDAVDLASGQIFINVLSGAGAVVDNFREHVGTNVALPVQFAQQVSGGGNKYIAVLALEPHIVAQAEQWYQQYWGLVDQERAKRQAAAGPAQGPPPAQQGFGQPQGQQLPHDQQYGGPAAAPLNQGFGQPQSTPPAQQQGFGAPPQGFGGVPQGQVPAAPQGVSGTPQGQAPGGMFNDGPPPMQQGQGFGAPAAGTDPAAAQAALNQLNGQLG